MSESRREDAIRWLPKELAKRRLVQAAGAALVGGQQHVSYLAELGLAANKAFLGYDAVDNEHFRTGADRARQAAHDVRVRHRLPKNYFLACARLVARKNLSKLIKAYLHYHSERRNTAWNLVICGEGPLRRQLAGYISASRTGSVMLAGLISYADLPAYYGLAGCLVLPSLTEQWGLVVNEAAACGLPVIVSKNAGCAPELVEEAGNGYLIDPRSITSLARSMVAMHDLSPSVRLEMGERSAELVKKFDLHAFGEGLRRALAEATESTQASTGS